MRLRKSACVARMSVALRPTESNKPISPHATHKVLSGRSCSPISRSPVIRVRIPAGAMTAPVDVAQTQQAGLSCSVRTTANAHRENVQREQAHEPNDHGQHVQEVEQSLERVRSVAYFHGHSLHPLRCIAPTTAMIRVAGA